MGLKPNLSGHPWVVLVFVLQLLTVLFLFDAKPTVQPLLRMLKLYHMGASTQMLTCTTEHFQIEYMPLDEKDVAMVASSAERSFQKLEETGFGYTGEEKIWLRIYPDTESLAQGFGWEKDEQAMGAYSQGMIGILAPAAWMGEEKSQERFDTEGPVLHELTHLLVDEWTQGHYNRWWTEGVAQYMEKKIYGFQMAPPVTVERLYSLEEMAQNFDRLQQRQVYWQSLQAVEYIVNHATEAALPAIMQAAAEEKDFYQGLSAVLGQDAAAFEKGYEIDMKLNWGTGCSVEQQPITH